MPELPEVETTVRGLKKKIIGFVVKGVWTDWPKYFRLHKNPKSFEKLVSGRKIISVDRRGKNILISLSGDYLLLIHQKMSGHLMVGGWLREKSKEAEKIISRLGEKWRGQKWLPENPESSFADQKNRFVRLMFFLEKSTEKNTESSKSKILPTSSKSLDKIGKNSKLMLAFSDLRRFGKVICDKKNIILDLSEIKKLGPEPLSPSFTLKKLKKIAVGKKGAIKKILLDQNFVSGIGNIYADEILWLAKINPLKKIEKITPSELKKIYSAIKKILPSAIKNRGTSMDDYRDPDGEKGNYEKYLFAYQKTGAPCSRCGTAIKRIKIMARSSHFCPKCQIFSLR